MRAWLPGILIAVGAAVFLVWGSLAEPSSAAEARSERASTVLASGILASVTDGDTLRLADNRRIRLVQIDAPELPQGECYSEQRTDALTRLAPIGTDVALRLDRALDAKDEHGRFLAYVTNGSRNLNLQLVEMRRRRPVLLPGQAGRLRGRPDASRAAGPGSRAEGSGARVPRTNLDPSRPVKARK